MNAADRILWLGFQWPVFNVHSFNSLFEC